jgi:iron complex transport system permease protein
VLLAGWRVLDVLRLGDAPAHHLGLEVDRARGRLLLAAAVVTAVVVSYAGPIAFVGLIVPHGARLLVGPGHRYLLPVVMLGGGAFLAVADCLARTVLAPAELPVGILTALVGGPFFLGLLFLRKGT